MKANKGHSRCQKKACLPQKEEPMSDISIQESPSASNNKRVSASNAMVSGKTNYLRGCPLPSRKGQKEVLHKSKPTVPQEADEHIVPADVGEPTVPQEAGPTAIPEKDHKQNIDVHCVDEKQDGKWLPCLNLTQEHKNIIMSENWLDDTIIDAAQKLLKQQFDMDGLQSCVLAQLGMKPVTREAVQIHYDTDRHHWFTTCFKKGIVVVADSLRTSYLSPSASKEICECYGNVVNNPLKRVYMLEVDQQLNGNDCGVYAIANAFELLSERNATCTYDHHQMRKHLASCLENGEITEFPKRIEI
ncbi:Hypothetical predicted protein [Pelobates cultripes]|uniref:Ubiquitin-like protease family profile domain-containing protein n=1 Tax=Pelobates cultripes TaxID=61616 RepID=A0AAD1WE07_PELCU|nr:Hypothetical predicted protein [Pelobates cultripes]